MKKPKREPKQQRVEGNQKEQGWIWPSYCFSCGVPLRGGATEHKDGCEIKQMIERHFRSKVE